MVRTAGALTDERVLRTLAEGLVLEAHHGRLPLEVLVRGLATVQGAAVRLQLAKAMRGSEQETLATLRRWLATEDAGDDAAGPGAADGAFRPDPARVALLDAETEPEEEGEG